jgi:hypothetical protein
MAVRPPKITTPVNVFKANFIHELGTGEKVGTAMYYLFSSSGGAPTVGNCQTLATTAASAWNSNCASLFTNNGLLVGCSFQDITTVLGAFGLVAVSHAGARAGAQPTTFSCAVVNYQISAHYRGGKPKGFWPFGIASDSSQQSDWGPSFISAVNSGVAALAAAIDGATAGTITVGAQTAVSFYQGALNNAAGGPWSRRNIPKPRATSVQYPVIGWSCATKIGSQRRRRI